MRNWAIRIKSAHSIHLRQNRESQFQHRSSFLLFVLRMSRFYHMTLSQRTVKKDSASKALVVHKIQRASSPPTVSLGNSTMLTDACLEREPISVYVCAMYTNINGDFLVH